MLLSRSLIDVSKAWLLQIVVQVSWVELIFLLFLLVNISFAVIKPWVRLLTILTRRARKPPIVLLFLMPTHTTVTYSLCGFHDAMDPKYPRELQWKQGRPQCQNYYVTVKAQGGYWQITSTSNSLLEAGNDSECELPCGFWIWVLGGGRVT